MDEAQPLERKAVFARGGNQPLKVFRPVNAAEFSAVFEQIRGGGAETAYVGSRFVECGVLESAFVCQARFGGKIRRIADAQPEHPRAEMPLYVGDVGADARIFLRKAVLPGVAHGKARVFGRYLHARNGLRPARIQKQKPYDSAAGTQIDRVPAARAEFRNEQRIGAETYAAGEFGKLDAVIDGGGNSVH